MVSNMRNPWEKIALSDYEKHMSLDSVYQLQALNEIMKEQFHSFDVDTVMILGIAGGNGLEHIDKKKYRKVYGVDVNEEYLVECQRRYEDIKEIFTAIHVDLLNEDLILPHAKLLIANLLVEYIGYENFCRSVKQVKPEYVSCVIQINTDTSFVSDSPYIHSFDCLTEVHHQMEEQALELCMKAIHYEMNNKTETMLPNGKKLVRMDFKKAEC